MLRISYIANVGTNIFYKQLLAKHRINGLLWSLVLEEKRNAKNAGSMLLNMTNLITFLLKPFKMVKENTKTHPELRSE